MKKRSCLFAQEMGRRERWIECSCSHICERQDKIKEEEEMEKGEGKHPTI